MHRHRKQPARGFALVITLIMVVLAAIIVISLLSSASSDRNTATSVADRYKADIAAASGLEAAKKALSAISADGYSRTLNDHFIVVSSPDANGTPYLFVGCAEDANNDRINDYTQPAIQYFPLYSGGLTQSNLKIVSGVAPTPAPSIDAKGSLAQQKIGGTTINYPLLFTTVPHSTWQKSLQTNWQVLNAPSATAEHYRFTYWIEDLSAYVDANVAGNIDDSGNHIRSVGYDPKEIALFTLFNPALSTDDGSTLAKTLVGDHSLLFTPFTVRVGRTAGSADDTACTTSLAANLSSDSERNVIPFGLGYKNQGAAKTNLNDVIKNSPGAPGVKKIADAITADLPKFSTIRKGGLDASQDYNKTIAANIIDYADTDSNATTGADYRGLDLYPLVVEYCDAFAWSSKGFYKGPNGNYFADVTVTPYIQVWNIFGKTIASGVLRFVDLNNTGLSVGTCPKGACTGATRSSFVLTSFDKIDSAASRNPMEGSIDFSTKNIGPNEYQVYQLPSRTYNLDTGSAISPDAVSPNPTPAVYIGLNTNTNSDDTKSSYQVYWNGVVVDQPGIIADPKNPSLMVRPNSTLDRSGNPDFHTALPGLRYSTTGNTGPFNLGDPRGSYYVKRPLEANAYDDSSWGGRIRMWNFYKTTWPAGESRIAGWADGGHNTANPGPSPKNATELPPVVAARATITANDASLAPGRISNDGVLHSIAELSYIYDPFQQNPFKTTPSTATDVDSAWRNAWKNGFNTASTAAVKAQYTSHSTLRIGRPEFKDFDTDDARASRLLDILSAGDIATNSLPSRGKININTASSEVLRTLGAGIKIGNLNNNDVDPAIQPASVFGPTSSATGKAADVFADAVTAARRTQPFISTAQLAQLKAPDTNNNSAPFFGNPDQWRNNDGPTVEKDGTVDWNDAASEQYFAKIFNFTTVRSRNFRIFVTGQVYVPGASAGQDRVIATANKVYQVFLKPSRDASGAITSQSCQVTYAADLPF